MQVRILNEKFGIRYQPLTVDYVPLQWYFRYSWVRAHHGENTIPPVISDDFVARVLDAALVKAALSPPTLGSGAHSSAAGAPLDSMTSPSTATHAVSASPEPEMELEPLQKQIDELLVRTITEKALVVPPGRYNTLMGEENARELATNLFFTLASAAFRLSRAAFETSEVVGLHRHSPLFQRCVAVFQQRYQERVTRACVPPNLTSDELNGALFTAYRDAVLSAFPTSSTHPDARTAGVIDQLLTHSLRRRTGEGTKSVASLLAATLSTLTVSRRSKSSATRSARAATSPHDAAAVLAVNETPMTESEHLFPDAEWQTDVGPRCSSCATRRPAVPLWYPGRFKGTPVHCRACGRALCDRCVTNVSHCSFAKLSDPRKPLEGTTRPVCDSCFKQFKGFQQLRFLGSLFLFSGFDFVHLLLSLGVGRGWTAAAELCISDHRFLLHTLSSRSQLALSPVRVLLQNSLGLLITQPVPVGGARAEENRAIVWHPEALLQLLRFIGEEQLWTHADVRRVVTMLAHSRIAGCVGNSHKKSTASLRGTHVSSCLSESRMTQLSHYHMWCTQFCPQMKPFFFYMKAMECIAIAPPTCDYAREALLALAALARTSIETPHTPLAALRLPSPRLHTTPATTSSSANAMGELELMTVWLLDLLQRPRSANMLTADEAVRQGLPALVSSCPQLLCWVLSMLRQPSQPRNKPPHISASPLSYDASLGERAAQVEALVLSTLPDAVFRTRALSTVSIFKRLDRWVQQKPSAHFTVEGVCMWFAENFAPVDAADLGFRHSALGQTTQRTLARVRTAGRRTAPISPDDYLDLRSPLCDPLHPVETTFRSLFVPGVYEEKASLGKQSPVWLCFSSWSREHYMLYKASSQPSGSANLFGAVPSSAVDTTTAASTGCATPTNDADAQARLARLEEIEGTKEERRSFLYKLENVDADNLMCVSFRLLQWLLRDHLHGADIPQYGVLPLSPSSGLIERAPGMALAQVDSLPTYLMQLSKEADQAVVARNFLSSLKLFLLMNHIFGIGDRHKGNVMISPRGAIFHIDFEYVFNKRPRHEMLSPAVRLDRNILKAADTCRQHLITTTQPPPAGGPSSAPLSTEPAAVGGTAEGHAQPPHRKFSEENVDDWFCNEAADLLLLVRPHAVLFYHLWIYGVHRCHILDGSEQALADYFNRLFDTTAFVESCRRHFIEAMHQSINKWALKDNSRSLTYTVSHFLGL